LILLIVLAGIGIGIVPAIEQIIHPNTKGNQEQSDKWYWIIAFIISTTFNAFQQIWQDIAFHDKNADIKELSCLAWYNLYSIPLYLITIPLEAVKILNGTPTGKSVPAAFYNQIAAFRCFLDFPIHDDVVSGNCEPVCATVWPLIFTAGYVGLFGFNALMIAEYGVLLPNIIYVMIPLFSTIVFMSPYLVSAAHVDAFNFWPIVGSVVIILGVLLKVYKQISAEDKVKTNKLEDVIEQEYLLSSDQTKLIQ